jgi:hypothetical protein
MGDSLIITQLWVTGGIVTIAIALFDSNSKFLGFVDLDQEGYAKRFAKPTTALPAYVHLDRRGYEEDLTFKCDGGGDATYLGCPTYTEILTIEVKHLRGDL